MLVKTAVTAFVAAIMLGACGVASATTQRAHLRLVDTAPLTIRGTGFRPHERVRVIYAADHTWTVRVQAGATGDFTARFKGVVFDICKLPRISAVGSLGTKATLKLIPPACPAP